MSFLADIASRLMETVEERTGYSIQTPEDRAIQEAMMVNWDADRKALDEIGYRVLNFADGGRGHEVRVEKRREMAAKARYAWAADSMIGGAVGMEIDFVFGRGVPRPRCADQDVQKIVDEAWDDPDNEAALTTMEAQSALGVDLAVQSNVFLVFFAGDDGKVKVSIAEHDSIVDAVPDPNNRLRTVYYVAEEMPPVEWDFDADKPKLPDVGASMRRWYYENFRTLDYQKKTAGDDAADATNERETVQEAATPMPATTAATGWMGGGDAGSESSERAQDGKRPEPKAPAEKLKDGWLYHVRTNRTSEMVFGVPEMHRTLRWASAYNQFMSARVDMAVAAAALIMKRTVKGSPNQVAKIAAQQISRRGELGSVGAMGTSPTQIPPASAGILTENDAVTTEPLNLNSGGAGAQADAEMIRAPFAVGSHWPQHYLGGDSQALAAAQSLELPVRKHIEARQEIWEQLYRSFIDFVIERAIETGKLSETAPKPAEKPPEGADAAIEKAKQQAADHAKMQADAHAQALSAAGIKQVAPTPGGPADPERVKALAAAANGNGGPPTQQAVEPEADADTKRDLSYEFSMPNPIQRVLADLVNAASLVAKTFDPNGTNLELSRFLLTVLLGEGFEVDDPAAVVEKIFPPGYVDPVLQATMSQGMAGGDQGGGQPPFTPIPPPGEAAGPGGGPSGEDNPYGVVQDTGGQYQAGGWTQEAVSRAVEEAVQRILAETAGDGLDDTMRAAARRASDGAQDDFDRIVGSTVEDVMAEIDSRMPPVEEGFRSWLHPHDPRTGEFTPTNHGGSAVLDPPKPKSRLGITEEWAQKAFGVNAGGLETHVTIGEPGWGGEVDVHGTVIDTLAPPDEGGTGQHGHFTLTIRPGRKDAYLGYMELDRSAQGRGFASRWLKQAQAALREKGIEKLKLDATLDNGAYTWAALGFDLAEPASPEARADVIADKVMIARSRKLISESEFQEIAPVLKPRGGKFDPVNHLWNMPMLAHIDGMPASTDPDHYNLGQRILVGEQWVGEKWL